MTIARLPDDPSPQQKAQEALRRMSEYKEDWDSYDAPPIPRLVTEVAKNLVQTLPDLLLALGFPVNIIEIAPVSDGSLAIEFPKQGVEGPFPPTFTVNLSLYDWPLRPSG